MTRLESCPEIKSNIASICVDNKKVREKISKQGALQISKVPCIMKVYEASGKVEQFEGETAFSIFNEVHALPLELAERAGVPPGHKVPDPGLSVLSKNNITSLDSLYGDIPIKENETPSRGISSKQDAITSMASQMQKEREELFPSKQPQV
jgi:hypothetical protein